jgi:hypothetical protein
MGGAHPKTSCREGKAQMYKPRKSRPKTCQCTKNNSTQAGSCTNPADFVCMVCGAVMCKRHYKFAGGCPSGTDYMPETQACMEPQAGPEYIEWYKRDGSPFANDGPAPPLHTIETRTVTID